MDEMLKHKVKTYCEVVKGEIIEDSSDFLVCDAKNSGLTLHRDDFLTINTKKVASVNILPTEINILEDYQEKGKKILQVRTTRNYAELFEDGKIYLKEKTLE